MTQISYIHAIPQDENMDRGAAMKQVRREYIPYLSLTEGEMQLELFRQRMQMFSSYYPDVPEYRRAVDMLSNVLRTGVHRGVSFVGAIPDELQQVAKVIANATRKTRPATGTLYGRDGIMNGIGAIIEVADSETRRQECIKKVNADPKYQKTGPARKAALQRCQTLFDIERIYNDFLERIGHHTVYNRLNPNYPQIPTRVDTKRLLHMAGIEGMANAAELNKSIVSDWVENGVLGKNAIIGAGLIGSEETSFVLSPNPDDDFSQYYFFVTGRKKDKIGIAPAAIAAVVTAIAAVVGAAFQFLTEIQKQKAFALSQAQGFGTSAYSGLQTDWQIGQNNPTTGEQNKKTLTLIAAAAGAYFLLDDN